MNQFTQNTIDGPGNVTTTCGRRFSHADHCVLAGLILDRFGYDKEAASAAWCLMLGNNSTVADFMELATPGVNLMHGPRKLWN